MSDQDPFKNDNPPQNENPFADQLKVIVNADGEPKYKTVEQALEALSHSQQHIQRLEQERKTDEDKMKELREEINKLGTVEDFVSRLKESNPQPKEPQSPQTPEPSGLKEEDIQNLINNAISKQKTEEQRKTNYNQVVEKIKEAYKDKAKEVFDKKAEDLGTSTEKLLDLAKENPKLVLSLFGEVKNTNSSITTSNVHIPPKVNDGPKPLEQPKKSLLAGASMKEQAEYMRQIRDNVYEKFGVET